MKHHTHVVLVSAQPTPNITPMLDQEIRPNELIMVVSPDMAECADWLDDVLKPRGIGTQRWPIENPYDLEQIQEYFLVRLGDLPDRDLALNVTGGTKPMAIAAYQAFIAAGKPIYYVHPEQDRLIWLHPSDRASRDLENRVKLEPFFLAHGATLRPRAGAFGVREDLFDLSQAIVSHVDEYQASLKSLNWLVAGADNPELISKPVPPELAGREDFERLLHCFAARDLVRWEQDCLKFESEANRFFVNGGWLEQYVYAIVQRATKNLPSIQDIGRGLELVRSRGTSGAANELDVAFLAENRLYVIECKTGTFNESEKADSALYKLKILSSQFGGLHAKSMLVSFQELPLAVKQRADTDRTEICVGTQLKTLEERLIKWVRGS